MRGRAGRHFFAVACALLLAALGLPRLASVDVAAASSIVATEDRRLDDVLTLLREDGTAVAGSADDGPSPAASPALQDSCGFGSVVQLEGTSHLWVLERDRRLHWAGDTRALDGKTVDWSCRLTGSLRQVRQIPHGDPWLSAGLVKFGEPIYLAKWETDQDRPTLLHVQTLRDLELFGIDGANYTRFVIDSADWERQFKMSLASLPRQELTSAVPAMPRIEAPREDQRWSCFPENPSCARGDPWWVEWNEIQSETLVEPAFAPGLVAERRFVEALWLIARWQDGRTLLSEAGLNGVWILSVSPETAQSALGRYSDTTNVLEVNRRFSESSTWLIADVLVHELQHAVDDRHGEFRGGGYARCILEQRAYSQESVFIRWLRERMGGVPSPAEVRARLSRDDFILYSNVMSVANAPDPRLQAVRDYPEVCGGGPGS
jgi:hypothetical protein